MIPTCGMIIGNSISGPCVSVDRYSSSNLLSNFVMYSFSLFYILCCSLLADATEKKHECETRLAFGSNRHEAILPVVKVSVLAALLPNLNQMAVIGFVSIPGHTPLHTHSPPTVFTPYTTYPPHTVFTPPTIYTPQTSYTKHTFII